MSIIQTAKDVLMVPIHPKGKPIILVAAILTVLFYLIYSPLGCLALLFTVFSIYFFRNPTRMVPQGDGFVLATGDGVICDISESKLPEELGVEGDELYQKVSIFLNVFNVHVNRLPVSGTITREVYVPGKFLNASLDKASTDNERSLMAITTDKDEVIACSQIAGLVARRIVCQVNEGDKAEQGARYGIIKFGSRCDVYIPKGYHLLVDKGTVAVGGETMLAIKPKGFSSAKLTWKAD